MGCRSEDVSRLRFNSGDGEERTATRREGWRKTVERWHYWACCQQQQDQPLMWCCWHPVAEAETQPGAAAPGLAWASCFLPCLGTRRVPRSLLQVLEAKSECQMQAKWWTCARSGFLLAKASQCGDVTEPSARAWALLQRLGEGGEGRCTRHQVTATMLHTRTKHAKLSMFTAPHNLEV